MKTMEDFGGMSVRMKYKNGMNKTPQTEKQEKEGKEDTVKLIDWLIEELILTKMITHQGSLYA